jgi:glycosyltransferase involved in cell wall biosynthesis
MSASEVRPVKIALITPGFSAADDDDCIPALLTLVRALVRCGCDVHVFALRYPPVREIYRVGGATVHPIGGGTDTGLRRPPLLARALAAIVREHRRQPFDGLHGIWADEPGFLAVTAGKILRRPSVVALSGGELVAFDDIAYGAQRSRLSRVLIAGALRHASYVTAGCSQMASAAAARIGRERLRLTAIGVDASEFFPLTGAVPLAGQPSLLHVAGLVPIKDQRTLLAAAARARDSLPDVHLHLVGDGPLRGQLAAQVESLGIARNVTFHGAHPHRAMAGFFRRADACVHSSRHEGQGLVVLEAAACARVTLGTRVGLIPDFAPRQATAPPGDAAALAEAMVWACAEPGRLAALGARALERFQSGYTIEHSVDALLALFGRVGPTARARAESRA